MNLVPMSLLKSRLTRFTLFTLAALGLGLLAGAFSPAQAWFRNQDGINDAVEGTCNTDETAPLTGTALTVAQTNGQGGYRGYLNCGVYNWRGIKYATAVRWRSPVQVAPSASTTY